MLFDVDGSWVLVLEVLVLSVFFWFRGMVMVGFFVRVMVLWVVRVIMFV